MKSREQLVTENTIFDKFHWSLHKKSIASSSARKSCVRALGDELLWLKKLPVKYTIAEHKLCRIPGRGAHLHSSRQSASRSGGKADWVEWDDGVWSHHTKI